jgi:hypothetical protein
MLSWKGGTWFRDINILNLKMKTWTRIDDNAGFACLWDIWLFHCFVDSTRCCKVRN